MIEIRPKWYEGVTAKAVGGIAEGESTNGQGKVKG
jgi:hypothetical protein